MLLLTIGVVGSTGTPAQGIKDIGADRAILSPRELRDASREEVRLAVGVSVAFDDGELWQCKGGGQEQW